MAVDSCQVTPGPARTVVPVFDARLDLALAPYRDPMVMMDLRCTCGRKFGVVGPDRCLSTVNVTRALGRKAHQSYAPRPSFRAESVDGLELCEGGTWRFFCHPRCKSRWDVNNTQLVEAFVRAAEAGRRELVFGKDL